MVIRPPDVARDSAKMAIVSDTIDLHWFLPTGGDSRDVLPAADGNRRAPTVEYLAQVARAADTPRLRRAPDPVRHAVRGRVAGHGGAHRRDVTA